MDDGYRALLHKALQHRPTVLLAGTALFVLALVLLPMIGSELMPQTDEGEVQVDVELPVGTRIERTEATILRLEQMVRELVPELDILISNGGGGGFMGGSGHRGSLTLRLKPRAERTRSNEQMAADLRVKLTGLPGVVLRPRASGGNNQMSRMFNMGGEGRLSLEIRGHDLEDSRALSIRAKALMDQTPGIKGARIGREEGRPELAVRVDRPKAALLGLRQSDVASTLRTNVAGTTAAQFRERGFEYPIVVRLREEDRSRVEDVDQVMLSAGQGQVLQAKNLLDVRTQKGPVQIERRNQERIARVSAEIEVPLSEAVAAVQARLPGMAIPRDFSVGFGTEVEEQAKAFNQLLLTLVLALILTYAVMASQYESLKDPFIIMFSVPLAAIGVVGALLLTGTTFSLQAYIGVIMLAGHRHQQRHPAGGLHERPPAARRAAAARGGRTGRPHAAAPDPDDLAHDGAGPRADGPGARRGLRDPGPAGARRHRRARHVDAHHARVRADRLHALRRGLEGSEARSSPRARRIAAG